MILCADQDTTYLPADPSHGMSRRNRMKAEGTRGGNPDTFLSAENLGVNPTSPAAVPSPSANLLTYVALA